MKQIKVKFVGFWSDFCDTDQFYLRVQKALEKYGELVVCDDPDYLFCSCFSDDWIDYDCVRIFYTGENLVPDFNAFDYAIGCDVLSFSDRYLKYNHYNLHQESCRAMGNKHLYARQYLEEKTGFCAFVVSKPSGETAASAREEMFYKLCNYKKVSSGGRYLNNIGQPDGVKDKIAFQREHKFCICFENSSHPGYSTEKLVQAFASGTVPIYWGDPLISAVFNEKAFINCHAFPNFDAVVEEIKRIDSDDSLYLSMLSQPALKDPLYIEKQSRAFSDFLGNIVSQPYEKAFRRNIIRNKLEPEELIRKSRDDRKKLSWRLWNKIDSLINK